MQNRVFFIIQLGFMLILCIFLYRNNAAGSENLTVVRSAQKRLTELGYDPGPKDGIWGSKTKEAVKKFQSDNKIVNTGVLDFTTKKHLGIEKNNLYSLNLFQIKEFLVFSMRVSGINVNTSDINEIVNNQNIDRVLSISIQNSGYTCSKIIRIVPLELKNNYEVVCSSDEENEISSYLIETIEGRVSEL